MRISTYFNLASKSKQELSALYRVIFNEIANPNISDRQKRRCLNLMQQIKYYIGMNP